MKKGFVKICSVWGGAGAQVAAGLAVARGGDGVDVLLVDAAPVEGLGEIFGARAAEDSGGPAPGPPWGSVHSTGTDNVGLLAGAGGVLAGADQAPVWALVRELRELGPSLAIVDLGDGFNPNRLDFLAISTEMVIAVEPGGESVQRGFNLLKDFVYRRMERVFSENPIISDLVTEATDTSRGDCVRSFADLCSRISEADERSAARALAEVKSYRPCLLGVGRGGGSAEAAEVLKNAAATYLGIDTKLLGAVTASGTAGPVRPDPSFRDAAAGLFVEAPALSEPSRPCDGVWTADEKAGESEEAAEDLSLEAPVEVFGYNDNVKHDGTVFHVQTEVSGGEDPMVETVVYHGGRVFFSKRARWSEVKEAEVILAGIRDFAKRQHGAAKAAVRRNKIAFKGYK